MWKDNIIVTNRKEEVLHAGYKVLPYINLWSEAPFAYPEGKAESGDILICFTEKLLEKPEEMQALKEMKIFEKTEDVLQNILLVAYVDNQEVKPLLKRNLTWDVDGEGVFLDTIYERNEIRVFYEKDVLYFQVNGQRLHWNRKDTEYAAVLIKDRGVKYFSIGTEERIPLQNLLAGQQYPARLDRNGVFGKPLQEFLNKKVYEKARQLTADGEEVCFAYSGRGLALRKELLSMDGTEHVVYLFEDAGSIMEELAEQSQKYKILTSGEIEGMVSGIEFNSFRFWGNEESIREMGRLLQKCSVTNTTVLLTGESGTGKTFLAREIHKNSKRSQKPFVHVNCAAIPYQLIESELFGYEEGAFTGARRGGKKGYFEMAHGGTLFLDEVGEIPLALQGKLLEVLQSRTFYQVGGTQKHEADVRLIAATNRNLKEMVKDKRFRADLYYRINVFPIEIPPLRKRQESLYSIIMDILPDICNRLEIGPLLLSSQAFEKMVQYPWPGNIRELENVLEKAAILSDSKIILPEDVMLSEEEPFTAKAVTLQEVRERAEREAIENALQMFHGDKNKAARYLDIGRSNMFEKVKRYHISAEGDGWR